MLPGGSGIVLTWIDAGAGELPAEVGMLPRRWHACLHASSRWVSVRAVSCCRVSVAVLSLLEFESSVSIITDCSSCSTHLPPTAAVVFLLVWFSNLQRFVCLGVIIKYLISIIVLFVVYYFPKKSISTTRNCRLFAGCSALGLFGLLYTVSCRCVCTCFWGCHK